jgi:hypothetical protein
MRSILACWLVLALVPAWADELRDVPLASIRATISLPEGWHVREEQEEEVIIYSFTREKLEEGGDGLHVGITLSVTTKVPERAGMSAGAYAAEMVTASEDEGAAPPVAVDDPPFKSYRVSYVMEGDGGNLHVVNVAKANETSGTLYFLSWQAPQAESGSLTELREKILDSLKVDPAF